MTPKLWKQLKPLFDAAVNKPAADREAFVATLDAEDEVRQELRDLLKAFEAGDTTLDDVAADLQALVRSACQSLQPNDVLLQRFRIVRWLGSGGMADVYEAVDLELGESVALKTLRSPIAGDISLLARLKREVQIARHLTSPNLCRIHELFVGKEDRPCLFFTMELLDGITLAEEIRTHGPLSWPKAREIANEICLALESMHAVGIIHRDIKTRNIMLARRNGEVHAVLMDFGLSRELAPSQADANTASTLPGTLVGTPACMAPEQFSGATLGPSTDIYAMGVVLYEMLTGTAPFPANDAIRAAIQRAKPPTPVSRLRSKLPHGLDRVIERCLEVEPQKRYQSANELARDLQTWSMLPGVLTAKARWSIIKWALCALLLIAVGIAAWRVFIWPPPPDPTAVSWYEAGVTALREGSYMQAARELEQSVKVDNRFAAAHARLAEAWAELDYTGAAEHEVLVALQKNPTVLGPLDRKYVEAVQATLARDFGGAVRRQEEILKLLPVDQKSYGYVDLGRAQEKDEDLAAAMKSYQTAANLRADNPAAFVHLGILTGRQQDFAATEAAFAAAEDLYRLKQNIEGLAEVYFQRAHWALERGNSSEAELWLDHCIQLARQIPSAQLEIRALTQLSNVEYLSNRDAKSIEDAGRAIQLARENHLDYWIGDGLIRQANAFLDKRDFAQAELLTQQALKIAEQHQFGRLAANARFTLASLCDQQGRREEQIQYARAAAAFYAKSGSRGQAADTEVLLSRGQMALGDLTGALQSATVLLKDSERLGYPARIQTAEMTLGTVLLEMQRYPQALAHLRRALELSHVTNRDVPYQLMYYAVTQLSIGNYSESEATLKTLSQQHSLPSNFSSEIALLRASTRLSQRRFHEAAAILSTARKQLGGFSPSELREFEYAATMADLETGHWLQAQRESRRLADLARQAGDEKSIAKSNYLLAVVNLRTGSSGRAWEQAQAAQAYYSRIQQPESEWMSFACLARVAVALGDSSAAVQNARKALDSLETLQQGWDNESRRYYSNRPDTRNAVAEMRSVLGSHD